MVGSEGGVRVEKIVVGVGARGVRFGGQDGCERRIEELKFL